MSPALGAIFWDNDGILVDTERLYLEATREACSAVGFVVSDEMFRQFLLVDNRGVWHLIAERGVPEEEIERLRILRNDIYSELLREREIAIPGVEETLQQLAPIVRMAVVTSSRPEHFQLIHSRTGLLRYFEFWIANGDYIHSKPAPDPYLAALARAKLPPEKVLVIEDSERGLRSAAAAGLRCCVIPSPLTQGSDFSGAELILRSICDLNLQTVSRWF